MMRFKQERLAAMSQPMRVLTSRATNEWYTSAKYIDLVRSVLGTIDLDPASDALPQGWIQATTYFNAGYRWYEELWRWPVCCVRERISFIRAVGKAIYLGRNRERFIEVFSKLGRVILP